ncbi:MAG: UDP-N-acetylmuramoyl-L-alanyl-D-glutamate--2,6-diaminopimelate ligase [Lachnospiraceae bacterium]|nr:UDP-N-acetylmuramoyl-L-alanyl-D-glutamate--2,6-diaminopimelate ligase [Lachnospiraceae bacterium]
MRTAKELLKELSYKVLQGDENREIADLVYNTKEVKEKCLFVCIEGAVFDSHGAAEEIGERGACVLVVQRPVKVRKDVTVVLVENTRYALALISAAYFFYPAQRLKVIGVTGTKGKTTATYMIRSILERAGIPTGLMGTIEIITGREHIPAGNTTPESYVIQKALARMVEAGCQVAVMEVSSQGLMLHRTAGIPFEIGIFTNIAPDHIGPNEHESFEEYMAWKGKLFRQCKLGLVNVDDAHWRQVLEGHSCRLETYGFSREAQLRAEQLELVNRPGYLGVRYQASGLLEAQVEMDLPGKFSVYNSLAALGVCRHFGIPRESMVEALKGAQTKGRIERFPLPKDFTLLIDYAHNAMSLENLLLTLREYHPCRLVCVFGCGGNRSRLRRFEMGQVSGRLADFTIITSDNPRFEEPLDIIQDIKTGIQKTEGTYVEIPDRREAIRYALEHGRPGDVIVLAGKGHEDYQEIKGVKYPMDERILIGQILKELGWDCPDQV